jgi:hypothetical protein
MGDPFLDVETPAAAPPHVPIRRNFGLSHRVETAGRSNFNRWGTLHRRRHNYPLLGVYIDEAEEEVPIHLGRDADIVRRSTSPTTPMDMPWLMCSTSPLGDSLAQERTDPRER